MIRKICFLLAICLLPFKYAQAQTLQTAYHGTNCMTANLAQGALFSWNATGLSNTHVIPLFVICPIPINHSVLEQDATDFQVQVDWYLPPTFTGGTTGPQCYLRVQQSGFGQPAPLYYINDESTASVFGGPNGFFAINDFIYNPVPWEDDTTGVTIDPLIGAHLLCLVPPGSTLISYNSIFEFNSMNN